MKLCVSWSHQNQELKPLCQATVSQMMQGVVSTDMCWVGKHQSRVFAGLEPPLPSSQASRCNWQQRTRGTGKFSCRQYSNVDADIALSCRASDAT